MAQVLEFRLPDLGEGLTEAEIVRWLVEVGDVVAVDQPVVEVETAKAMVDVPCPYGGVVTARFGEEGTELPVGAPLITVAVGESGTSAGNGSASGNVLVGYGTSEAPSRRRRVRPAAGPTGRDASAASDTANTANASTERAERVGAGAGHASASGEEAGSPVAPVASVASVSSVVPAAPVRDESGPVAVISPLVRRLARENGVDLRRLSGSGPDGLILRVDVEDALRADAARGRTPVPVPAPVPAPVPDEGVVHGTRIPLRGVRGVVADKLSRSRREIPDATCWVDADATELLRARTAMNASGGPKISLLALLARICTAALARFPDLNSTVDLEAREVVRLDEVHLGFAAQTERGLVVPVVRDAHARDAESLTAEFARLTEAARAGTLTPADLTGGTFTLNNYGVFGVDGSTPIINHPEAAMLGVGRIVPKPWVYEGELAVRQVVQLSFTFDHRVCDGGTAGGFLRYVADCVEQPAVLLRTL
ncbi:2-oxoisovalerate dehydrogenase E2 component (dihydrolipoyl transacylase) [Streptomyces sp. B3I7]|uniref:dihydrolipoamide acetyltransferase family protein n=1 Tax=Streptomyces sp. B3I7 TaxID=3042269 RepID=UPI0027814189|nr:dihydrolipoamide acetyltransferase family protein [Streptomyces sp. B3I7]MDQ0812316.1 2-oxoisovalerate dehydrogenase E2 component (dihydrolipoyl transacylase) [Streptomyces sp. B3I7]